VHGGAVTEIPPKKFTKLGDNRIAYQVVGEAPVDLLRVPGIGDALDIRWEYEPYANFLWRLASFSRLIMLDRRGMGASDPVPLEALPTWEEFADDAMAVLDALGSDRPVLLGANDAGPAAILFAAIRPERTHSLILFNSVRFRGAAEGCLLDRVLVEGAPDALPSFRVGAAQARRAETRPAWATSTTPLRCDLATTAL
jgi:pimeloyl-ACP methyl ester carboxylesterase